jgi:hypothetical protein
MTPLQPLEEGETDYSGEHNYLNYIATTPFVLARGNIIEYRMLEEKIAFSENLFLCPTANTLLIAERDSRTVVGYQGRMTRFSYNTSFISSTARFSEKNGRGIFCLAEEGKLALTYTQRNPSSNTDEMQVAVFSSSFPTRVSTRLLYIQKFEDWDKDTSIIPSYNPEDDSLSFFYTTHKQET